MEIQTVFAFLAVVGQIILIGGVLGYFLSKHLRRYIRRYLYNFGYIISFFIALSAMLGSLYFSDVVGWEPCVLCWYQRIAMYPLVVIFALGVWRQDLSAKIYGLALASIGLLISGYQIYLQVMVGTGQTLSSFCSTLSAVDCSKVYLFEFGYITFPVMSATAFLLIIVLQLGRA